MTRSFVVVDDSTTQREGRLAMLRSLPEVVAHGLTFEEALARTDGWAEVDTVVLDGHDRRSHTLREQAAQLRGVPPVAGHDRFPGPRVAQHIRRHAAPDAPTLILISAYVRDDPRRTERIAQSGIDYAYEHYEVDGDRETFLRAVTEPERFAAAQPAHPAWSDLGYAEAPDVAQAIDLVEREAAGTVLIDDTPVPKHLEWSFRQLRVDLNAALPRSLPPTAGPRQARAPSKSWLQDQFRSIFGRDLPVDPS